MTALYEEYQKGKQTYEQLAHKYNCSTKTIKRRLDKYIPLALKAEPRAVIVLMDTTYWGRIFGVMLFRDSITKKNLLKYYVKSETVGKYKEGVSELIKMGFEIKSIVCDGKPGLLKGFGSIPVQMCQFHQKQIVKRYLTKRPKLLASQELQQVVDMLCITDKESFEGGLKTWYLKWKDFINERTLNPENGKSYYTHKRLRSAYRSLNKNLENLFVWYDNYDLKIPNTTKGIDGHFSDLKNKLRNHNGLSEYRKKKFIDSYFQV